MVHGMTDPAVLQALHTRIDTATRLHHGLVACFNALAEGRYDDQRLRNLVAATLQSNGLQAAMPLQQILDGIEPLHTGMIVEEARLLTQSSEEAQLRMRLLLKSPRAVYGLSDLGDDDLFAPFAPVVANEITHLHAAYVPYAHQTSENFMKAAARYPSGHIFEADMDAIESRRACVAQEYVKLRDGMVQGEMSIGQLEAFYRPYRDMTFQPAQDYALNTTQLCDTHITIANTNMARLGLRITQAYLILTNSVGAHALATDGAFKADFDTKYQETANGFQRTALHLDGGTVTDGPIYGASQYLAVAKAYKL